jgi:hypothetical protein
LPLLRKLGLLGERLEFGRVGPDHHADHVIGALQIEPMLVIECELVSLLLVAIAAENPALRRREQHALGKHGMHLERGHDRKRVCGVLLTPEHRHVHFGDQHMTHFVGHHEHRVSHDEFQELLFRLRRQLLQPRRAVERLDRLGHRGGDSGLRLRRLRRLRGCGRRVGDEGDDRHRAGQEPGIREAACHRMPRDCVKSALLDLRPRR